VALFIKIVKTSDTSQYRGFGAHTPGMIADRILYKQCCTASAFLPHFHLLQIDKTFICLEGRSQQAMGANASHTAVSLLPSWMATPLVQPAVPVQDMSAAQVQALTAAMEVVAPKTISTTVLNTGAHKNAPAHGNAAGKKRKRVDTSEDEPWPGSVNTEYHGQPRAIKRACTVMASIAEEC
jgi:hypothetical protein